MAATWNQPRTMGFMNVEQGGFGPIGVIDSIMFRMIMPLGNPTLEINSVTLSMTDPGDTLLSPVKLVDQFGQWTRVAIEGIDAGISTAFAGAADHGEVSLRIQVDC